MGRTNSLSPAGLIQLTIEAQIRAGQTLGDIEYLPIMHSEMLHDMIDSFQPAHLVTLYLTLGEQISLSQPLQHLRRLRYGRAQFLQQR